MRRQGSRLAFGLFLILIFAILIGFIWWRRNLPPPQVFDLMVVNGRIVDGTGKPAFEANIGIKGNKIVAIGLLPRAYAPIIIDAQGCIVAPGFIDVHAHVEANLPKRNPFRAPNFIRQGVTTFITGNCGSSVEDVKEMFWRLRQYGSQVNVATLIGHNTIRRKVMRNATRPPNHFELQQMEAMVRKAMEDGALGLSTGLEYLPGMFATQQEIIALAKIAGEYGGLYVTHLRDEGLKVGEAIQEALEIGRQAKVAVHISHLKIAAPKLWGTAKQILTTIDEAHQNGLQIAMDCYPYTSSSTSLTLLLPRWSLEGGDNRLWALLRNRALLPKIREDMVREAMEKGWTDFSFARIAFCWFDPSLNGWSISEIAQFNHKWREKTLSLESVSEMEREAQVVLELLRRGGAQMIYDNINEDDLLEITRHKGTVFGSDSSVRYEDMKGKPHPRGYGTFPRILAHYVREKTVLTLEEAIRKMTSLPARVFRLEKRGEIKVGYFADLVIFDEKTAQDTATYDNPLSPPVGIYFVLVNGKIVCANGQETGIYSGKPIFRGDRN